MDFLGAGAGSDWSSSGTGVFRVPLLGVVLALDEELGFLVVVVVVSTSSVGVGVVRPRVTRVGGGFEGTSGVLRVRRTILLPAAPAVCDCSSASAVAVRVLRAGSELGTG